MVNSTTIFTTKLIRRVLEYENEQERFLKGVATVIGGAAFAKGVVEKL